MKGYWWKIISVVLVLYSIIGGILMEVPRVAILNETIRNLYFHVPMWFSMILLMGISFYHSIRYLANYNTVHDIHSREAVNTGFIFGILGIVTGSIWAKVTWGAWWTRDPRLDGAAVTLLIYLAYMVLRGSLEDEQKRARVSAVYNIFAFILLVVFLIIYPRMSDSLHPGTGGNPGFSVYENDLDNRMRIVFYPAVIGWILIGIWIQQLNVRIEKIKVRIQNTND